LKRKGSLVVAQLQFEVEVVMERIALGGCDATRVSDILAGPFISRIRDACAIPITSPNDRR
jgi:hypothetical protein